MAISKIGDYLLTIEEGLAIVKEEGLAQINRVFGQSVAAEQLSQTHKRRFENDLSRAFRYSAVILLYTAFESRSRLFQEEYEARHGKAPTCPDKRCSLVKNLQYSMEHHAQPVLIDHPKIWDRLEDISAVRNSIAHSAGLFRHSTRKSDLKRLAASSEDIDFDSDGYLVIGPAFPARVCDIIYTFFSILFTTAGFRLDIPEKLSTSLSAQFQGFENEINAKINEYYAKKSI